MYYRSNSIKGITKYDGHNYNLVATCSGLTEKQIQDMIKLLNK